MAARWTKELEVELEQRWRAGESASEIARAMGLATKNQVIGKAHRLGLTARSSPLYGGMKP